MRKQMMAQSVAAEAYGWDYVLSGITSAGQFTSKRTDGTWWGFGSDAYVHRQYFTGDTLTIPEESNESPHTPSGCQTGESFAYSVDAGGLYCIGRDLSGALALGLNVTETPRSPIAPQGWLWAEPVPTKTDWTKVCCSGRYVIALDSSGDLWASGDNGQGQLGLGDFTIRWELEKITTNSGNWVDVNVGGAFSAGLDVNGEMWVWGRDAQVYQGDERSAPP